MGIPVLVVDANKDTGKLIQKSLESNGLFQVTLATRAIEALMRFTETKFHVAVVDFGLPDLNGVDLIRQMLGIDESITIVAVLDEQDSQALDLKKLSIEIILDKPAYLADLPTRLSNLFNLPSPSSAPDLPPPDPAKFKTESVLEGGPLEDSAATQAEKKEQEVKEVRSEVPQPEEEDRIPPWLQDPSQVKEYLSQLGKEHSAYASLLSRGATPWNFSETITENQAQGIVRLLSEHDEGLQSKGALIRYIRLSGTGNDYLLYATPVVADINLSLVFSMETPFSVARRQAHKLSRLLANEDPRKPTTQLETPIPENLVAMSQDDDEPLLPSNWIPGSKSPATSPEPVVQPERMPAVEDLPEPVVRPERMPVVEDVPEPDPIQEPPSLEEQLMDESTPVVEEMPAMESAPSTPVAEEMLVMESVQPAPVAVEEPILESTHTPPVVEGKIEADLASEPSSTSPPEVPPLPTDWLPRKPKPASHLPFLDPLPRAPEKIKEPDPVNIAFQEPKYYLPFTAILLPRFPNHKLVGSLANQLETWLNDLCIAWGWRMATIDLRPEFLRFTVNLSPEVAPAQSVQNLAQNLSTRILQAFPGLADDLPSGQFWTKSYLLTAGSDVGKDRLATFIETTRKEQGLTN